MTVSDCNLLTLPTDLLVRDILARLDLPTLRSCSLLCKSLNHTIKSSVLINYLIKLQEMDLIDNPAISYDEVPLSRRLEMLKDYSNPQEIKWKTKQAVPPGRFNPYSIRGDAGVIYVAYQSPENEFLAEKLHWTNLPSKEHQVIEWNVCRPPDPSAFIISHTLSIAENDLLVFATWKEAPSTNTPSPIQIHLIQHSTQLPFPGLASPILDICDFTPEDQYHHPFFHSAIRGTNLAVLVRHAQTSRSCDPSEGVGHLSIWNWKSGEARCKELIISDNNMGLLFLREDILLLSSSSTRSSTLDIYQVPMSISSAEVSELRLIERLGLPSFKVGQNPHHSELSPMVYFCNNQTAIPSFTESSNPNVRRLFSPETGSSIIRINLIFNRDHGNDWTSFFLIIHRRALLDRADRALFGHENGRDIATRWEEWGPELSRMFWYHNEPDDFFDALWGSRFFVKNCSSVGIFDFGRANTANGRIMGPPEECQRLSDLSWVPDQGDEHASQGNWFQDVVRTKLPFEYYTFGGTMDGVDVEDWDDMHVDQNRIVGLTAEERIDVIYFG